MPVKPEEDRNSYTLNIVLSSLQQSNVAMLEEEALVNVF